MLTFYGFLTNGKIYGEFMLKCIFFSLKMLQIQDSFCFLCKFQQIDIVCFSLVFQGIPKLFEIRCSLKHSNCNFDNSFYLNIQRKFICQKFQHFLLSKNYFPQNIEKLSKIINHKNIINFIDKLNFSKAIFSL